MSRYEVIMEVIPTIENEAGERGSVSATGKDYAAYEAAGDLVPQGCRAIAIRTDA
ncbi:hypothetical protein ACIQTW_19630 [Paenarthrobacter sp. NPDC090517]|uniref:hypothetical protein n=1 Tax=Paenarthrobacter sp. NPDC090517 TaxID=3364381 RepID=UPI0037F2BA6B